MLSDKKVSRIPFNCWYSSSSWTASLEGKPWRSVGLLEIFLTETVQPVRKELTGSWPVGDNIVQKQSALSTRLTVRYRWKAGELLTVHPTFSYSLWRRFKQGDAFTSLLFSVRLSFHSSILFMEGYSVSMLNLWWILYYTTLQYAC